jgi:hypothetical protein
MACLFPVIIKISKNLIQTHRFFLYYFERSFWSWETFQGTQFLSIQWQSYTTNYTQIGAHKSDQHGIMPYVKIN